MGAPGASRLIACSTICGAASMPSSRAPGKRCEAVRRRRPVPQPTSRIDCGCGTCSEARLSSVDWIGSNTTRCIQWRSYRGAHASKRPTSPCECEREWCIAAKNDAGATSFARRCPALKAPDRYPICLGQQWLEFFESCFGWIQHADPMIRAVDRMRHQDIERREKFCSASSGKSDRYVSFETPMFRRKTSGRLRLDLSSKSL